MEEKRKVWLNAACIGRVPTEAGRYPDSAGASLVDSFDLLREWTQHWLQSAQNTMVFLESTTAACDVALLALLGGVQTIVHTSSAHPTIRASVHSMTEIAARLTANHVSVHQINLENITTLCVDEYVKTLCRYIDRLAVGSSIVILEHVTYDHGVRLPIEEVTRRFSNNDDISFLIDGAQAIGLWRPSSAFASKAYIGCYHKYAGGPEGTAFASLEGVPATAIPYSVGCTASVSSKDANGLLPTMEIGKWPVAAREIPKLNRLEDLAGRLAAIEEFNTAFDDALKPLSVSLGKGHDPNLRSHISSLPMRSCHEARVVVKTLEDKGVFLQQIGNLVRVSGGHDADAACGEYVGTVLRQVINQLT